MADNKRLRALEALAMDAGVASVDSVELTGRMHVVMQVVAPNGRRKKFYMAYKTSCHRADKNNLSLMRRFVRENAPAPTHAH